MKVWFSLRLLMASLLLSLMPGVGDADDEADAWPDASCELAGTQPSTNWTALMAVQGTLDASDLAMLLACAEEGAIRALPVVSDSLRISGRCPRDQDFREMFCDDEGGRGVHCWGQVDNDLTVDWKGASSEEAEAEAKAGPGCSVAQATFTAAWSAPPLQRAWLDCWTAGYLDSSYERLETLHEQSEALVDDMTLIFDIYLEQSLHRYGGSMPSSLYLPESMGGDLETVGALVDSIAERTESAGYVLSPDVDEALNKAGDALAAGNNKGAVRFYRLAYDKITVQSTSLATEASP